MTDLTADQYRQLEDAKRAVERARDLENSQDDSLRREGERARQEAENLIRNITSEQGATYGRD